MNNHETYDVAIVGGGLAGLACAILISKMGYDVILFEKENYPFHKVCGEYISLESYDFLISLELPLAEKKLPLIRELMVSSTSSGRTLRQTLPLGGIGISRYQIDAELAVLAEKNGTKLLTGTKVTDVVYENDHFHITAANTNYRARLVCGTYGKRSNLDVKWNRPFTLTKANALNNFIGVKYHMKIDHTRDTIDLHNFPGGYCGVSPIEDDKFCVCYLTTARQLKNSGNNISAMEEKYLFQNPFIKSLFLSADNLYEKPETISQISFEKKELVNNHVVMIGDAASLITPLCGNGMSMALHGSRIACEIIPCFLAGKISRQALEELWQNKWNDAFATRLMAGRMLQHLFGRTWVTNTSIGILSRFPSLLSTIIRQTHG